MFPSFLVSVMPACLGSLIHWFLGSSLPCFLAFLVSWFLDSLIPWFFDSLAPWFLDSWIPWFLDSLENLMLPNICPTVGTCGQIRIVWSHCVLISDWLISLCFDLDSLCDRRAAAPLVRSRFAVCFRVPTLWCEVKTLQAISLNTLLGMCVYLARQTHVK